MQRFFEVVKDMAKSFRFMLPLVFIFAVILMFYLRFTQSDARQTVKDIIYTTSKISSRQEVLFSDFNNDTVVYSGYLPIDIKSRMTDDGYIIRSRFGTQIKFMEAFKTKEEKEYFLSFKNEKEYKKHYKGSGAYIISFPRIRRSACMRLARTNWRKKVPNFMGIEVGRINNNNPNVGTERLNYGLLAGLSKIDYDGPDKSFVANRRLSYREAFKSCHCLLHNKCVVSLKFY